MPKCKYLIALFVCAQYMLDFKQTKNLLEYLIRHIHTYFIGKRRKNMGEEGKKMKRKDCEKKIKLKLVYCIIDNIIGHSGGKIESAHKSHLAMSVICYLFRLRKSYFSFRQRTLSDTYIPKHTQYTHTHTLTPYTECVLTNYVDILLEEFTCTHVLARNLHFSLGIIFL